MRVHFVLDGAFRMVAEGVECQRVTNLILVNASSSRDLLLAELPILAFALATAIS